jgi:L-lysine exporter family protein LysE/ArgO
MLPATVSAFTSGMLLSLSLIIAIGPQNAYLLRVGLTRQHLWLSVAVCAAADMTLIGIGILGLAQLGALSERIYGALLGGTVVVLLLYGWQAAHRFWVMRPTAGANYVASEKSEGSEDAWSSIAPTNAKTMTRQQAIASALGFSWLNPHAWVDTAVLIGGASLAYQADARTGFGAGAMVGSLIWFIALGTLACWLGKRLGQSNVWHWIDAVVALMMWAIAATIAVGLIS